MSDLTNQEKTSILPPEPAKIQAEPNLQSPIVSAPSVEEKPAQVATHQPEIKPSHPLKPVTETKTAPTQEKINEQLEKEEKKEAQKIAEIQQETAEVISGEQGQTASPITGEKIQPGAISQAPIQEGLASAVDQKPTDDPALQAEKIEKALPEKPGETQSAPQPIQSPKPSFWQRLFGRK